jgi:hypothetical protein
MLWRRVITTYIGFLSSTSDPSAILTCCLRCWQPQKKNIVRIIVISSSIIIITIIVMISIIATAWGWPYRYDYRTVVTTDKDSPLWLTCLGHSHLTSDMWISNPSLDGASIREMAIRQKISQQKPHRSTCSFPRFPRCLARGIARTVPLRFVHAAIKAQATPQ